MPRDVHMPFLGDFLSFVELACPSCNPAAIDKLEVAIAHRMRAGGGRAYNGNSERSRQGEEQVPHFLLSIVGKNDLVGRHFRLSI